MRISRFIWFMIMIAIGAGLGLYYAWVVNPVDFVDAAFHHLRQDYKADYVLMVAEIYDNDHVLYQAMMRLDMLTENSADEAVANAIQTAQGFGYSEVDMNKLYQLQSAVSGGQPTATPVIDQTLQASFKLTDQVEATDSVPDGESAPTESSVMLPTLEINPFGNETAPVTRTNVPAPTEASPFENSALPTAVIMPVPESTALPEVQIDLQNGADDFLSFGDSAETSGDTFIRTEGE